MPKMLFQALSDDGLAAWFNNNCPWTRGLIYVRKKWLRGKSTKKLLVNYFCNWNFAIGQINIKLASFLINPLEIIKQNIKIKDVLTVLSLWHTSSVPFWYAKLVILKASLVSSQTYNFDFTLLTAFLVIPISYISN